jgi:type I restriction enzyme M protein
MEKCGYCHICRKIEEIKETMLDQFAEEKKTSLDDYPIFMTIAENIGYDATGKTIPYNDIPEITVELSRFIEAIENGQDRFFQ